MKTIVLKKIEEGSCPYCGEKDLEYGVLELTGDYMVYYPVHCTKCRRDFEEWYKLSFTGMNVGEFGRIIAEEGMEIDDPLNEDEI